MYEFLKKLFGTNEDGTPKALTADELEAAITADKDIQVVNIKEGGYVSKDKFDAKDKDLKHAQTQLSEANERIKGYESQDIETIKKDAAEWKEKFDKAEEQHKADMEAMDRSHHEDMLFNGIKFASKGAKAGIRAEFQKQNFVLKDGVFQGADAWLEQMRKDDPASFEAVKPEDNGGDNNGEGGDQGAGGNGNGAAGGNGNAFNGFTGFNGGKLPKFATSTSKGSGQSMDQNNPNPFGNLGLRHVREPKQ